MIDTVVDKPSTMMIINGSRWSSIEPITKSNKGALLQQLLLEEVVIRRQANMQAFSYAWHEYVGNHGLA